MAVGNPHQSLRIGVIGGGPAGAMCARTLSKHVAQVTVFDKGRGPGGRLSTRRHDDTQFDHGAPYLNASESFPAAAVPEWCEAGVLAPWRGYELDLSSAEPVLREPPATRLVGVPGMNALVRHLQRGLDVRFATRATEIRRVGPQIEISFADASPERFDVVVVAVPGPQAADLLGAWPELQKRTATIRYTPCWATMIAFAGPLDVAWSAARTNDPRVSWIARENTKPGRPKAESWVLHATPEWTRAHLDDEKDDVAQVMLEASCELVGVSATPTMVQSHRWLYALAEEAVGEDCLFADGVGVCGDGLRGNQIGSAVGSGLALAKRILAT